MIPHECPHCRCYESPPVKPVIAGDRVRNRLTGEVGTVACTQEPNPPWHYGGVPYVMMYGTGRGWWHYYDIIPPVGIGQRIRHHGTDEVAIVKLLERGDAYAPRVINAKGYDAVWHDYDLVEDA